MYSLSFDKAVYSDAGLTIEDAGPFDVRSTTDLPAGIYFSATEYKGTAKDVDGNVVWKIRFTSPAHINPPLIKNVISAETGAVYDE